MTNETIDQTTTPDQTLNQTDFVPQRFINNLQAAFIKVDNAVASFDPDQKPIVDKNDRDNRQAFEKISQLREEYANKAIKNPTKKNQYFSDFINKSNDLINKDNLIAVDSSVDSFKKFGDQRYQIFTSWVSLQKDPSKINTQQIQNFMENIIQPPISDDKEKAEFLRSAKQSFAGIIIGNQIRSDEKFMGVFDEFLKARQEAEKNAEPTGGDWLDIFLSFVFNKKQSSDLKETLHQEPRPDFEQNIATTTTDIQGLPPEARDLLDERGNFSKFTLGDMEMLDVEGVADKDPNYKFNQLLIHNNALSSVLMGSHSGIEPEKVSLLYGDNGGPEARHDWNATVGYKNQQGSNVATLINAHLNNGSGLVIAGNENGIKNPSFYLYKQDQLTGLKQALSQEEIQNKVDFMEFLAQNNAKLDNLSEKEKEKFQTEIGNFQKDRKAYLDALGSDHIAFVSKKDPKHLALVTEFGNGEVSYTLKDYGKKQDKALDGETKTTLQGSLKYDGVMFVDYSNFKYTNVSKSPDKGLGATNGVSHLEANFSKVAVFNLPNLNNLAITNYIRRDLEDKLWAKGLSPQEANKLIKDFLNSNKELVGKVSNFNKAVAEAKNTGNYDEVKKAQKDLEKSLRKRESLEKEVAKKLESRNDNKNRMEAKAQANSQKDKIFALINKEASKEARAAAFDPNLKGVRSELSDKLENINKNLKDFGKSFDELKNGKNNDFSKAEETLKALKDSVKDLGINPEWISKIENLNAALNDFKNGKNKDFSKVTQAKSDLENSIKDVIINQKITDKVDNLNQAVSETKLTGNFSKVEQALAELKNLSLDLGKNSDLQFVRDGVRGTLVGNGLSKTEATTLTKNFSDIRKELSEKLFGKSNNNNNGLKNNEEPIYAQVNKKKAGQATSPEEPIYAQVARKMSVKIDQLNEAASAINRKIDRINKIASAGKGVGGFSGAGQSASPEEPIYAQVAKKVSAKIDQLNESASAINRKIDRINKIASAGKGVGGFSGAGQSASPEEPIYAQVAKKVRAKIDQLNESASAINRKMDRINKIASAGKGVGGFRGAGQSASPEEPIYAQVAKKVRAKIDQLNESASAINRKMDRINKIASAGKGVGGFSGAGQSASPEEPLYAQVAKKVRAKIDQLNESASAINRKIDRINKIASAGKGVGGFRGAGQSASPEEPIYAQVAKKVSAKIDQLNESASAINRKMDRINKIASAGKGVGGFSGAGQSASPEEPLYAQVAKKVSAKIDQLNESASAINRKIDRINKIASAGKGVGGFSGAGQSASPEEPLYAQVAKKVRAKIDQLNESASAINRKMDRINKIASAGKGVGGFRGAGQSASPEEPLYAQVAKKVSAKIDQLNESASAINRKIDRINKIASAGKGVGGFRGAGQSASPEEPLYAQVAKKVRAKIDQLNESASAINRKIDRINKIASAGKGVGGFRGAGQSASPEEPLYAQVAKKVRAKIDQLNESASAINRKIDRINKIASAGKGVGGFSGAGQSASPEEPLYAQVAKKVRAKIDQLNESASAINRKMDRINKIASAGKGVGGFRGAGQSASPEEPLYAQVAKKVSAKIDQLNESASAINRKMDRINKIASAGKGVGGFRGAGQSASPEEPIYAQVAKKVSAKIDQLNESASAINRKMDRINKIASAGKGVGGFRGAGQSASPEEPLYAQVAKKVSAKIDQLNESASAINRKIDRINKIASAGKGVGGFSGAGQSASPEEPIYAQVAKKVSAKIDQLNESASAINRKIDRINKIASAGKGVGGFSGAGQSASPEPIYATIDFDEANQAGFSLRRSAAVNDLSKVGLSREQELTRRIGDLNQAVSEAKAGHFDKLEQKIDELKDSTKKNALKLWVESAKQVPTGLQAKLDNYATNSHTRINSNVQSGTINEKATGMLTQKNPEWLKLVNDKIVAHNVGSAHLSEYDKIGFNQKNMKDYSDSFKFSTKLNNAVKDIKSSFVQFLTNTFSTGSYSLMKANVEHGVKNTTKGGFQKS